MSERTKAKWRKSFREVFYFTCILMLLFVYGVGNFFIGRAIFYHGGTYMWIGYPILVFINFVIIGTIANVQ